MKKLLSLLLLLSAWLAAPAQDYSWMANSPDGYKYLTANTQIIISRDSPCNQGEEAFMDFIPQFRKDEAFRNSRLRFDPEDEMGITCIQYCDYSLIKAGVKKLKGEKIIGNWYNISPDEVCFRMDEFSTDPNSDWGGSGMFARFQRIDGKWYCTGCMLAG